MANRQGVDMKPLLIFATVAPLLVAVEALGAQDLTVDETYRIVIAEDRTKAEEYAAAQLQEYLKRITGKDLRIVHETDQNAEPAIYLGQTRFAAAAGMKDYAPQLQKYVGRIANPSLKYLCQP